MQISLDFIPLDIKIGSKHITLRAEGAITFFTVFRQNFRVSMLQPKTTGIVVVSKRSVQASSVRAKSCVMKN